MIIPLKDQLKQLETLNPDFLVAPASVLCEIASYIETGELNINPKKVMSAAEVLDKADEKYLAKVFHQKIHQIYQCTEGFLAATCTEGHIHLNEEYIHIEKEYLDEEKTRFIPIITDLFRKTQPIVRYRLNDILVEDKTPCPCGSKHLRLSAIEGREDDIFYLKRKASQEKATLYPDFLRRTVIGSTDAIEEYSVIQTEANRIEIQLESTELENAQEAVKASLSDLFSRLEIEEPEISFAPYQMRELTQKKKRIRRDYLPQ